MPLLYSKETRKMPALVVPTMSTDDRWLAHMPPVDITGAEASILLDGYMRFGDVKILAHRLKRIALLEGMEYKGLVDIDFAENGVVGNMTVNGYNSMYRFFNNRHRSLRNCNGVWLPNGKCAKCGTLRMLDRAAFDIWYETLTEPAKHVYDLKQAYWCRKHGWLRPSQGNNKIGCTVLSNVKDHPQHKTLLRVIEAPSDEVE